MNTVTSFQTSQHEVPCELIFETKWWIWCRQRYDSLMWLECLAAGRNKENFLMIAQKDLTARHSWHWHVTSLVMESGDGDPQWWPASALLAQNIYPQDLFQNETSDNEFNLSKSNKRMPYSSFINSAESDILIYVPILRLGCNETEIFLLSS